MQKGIRLTTLWLKYMSIPMRPSELKLYVRVHILKNVCVYTYTWCVHVNISIVHMYMYTGAHAYTPTFKCFLYPTFENNQRFWRHLNGYMKFWDKVTIVSSEVPALNHSSVSFYLHYPWPPMGGSMGQSYSAWKSTSHSEPNMGYRFTGLCKKLRWPRVLW